MESFETWFHGATGREPYPYQAALAQAEHRTDVLAVPTGCGKTQALIGSWLYRRLQGQGPRRLVYALPMRALVEQTVGVAEAMRERLGLDANSLPIRALIGGSPSDELRDWREHPECHQIIVGTIDMLLSRALNRGFAESRFAWEVAFGLLNNDCLWVFDEVQLMGPALTTSTQLDGLRAKLGVVLPCETIWASATIDPESLQSVDRPAVGTMIGLSEADRNGSLSVRLSAEKELIREDLEGLENQQLVERIAACATANHEPATRTMVVLNRVELAQQVYIAVRDALSGEAARVVLLHSRFREGDRADHMNDAVADPPAGGGTIVVATQVVEAGLDISARALLTQTAPLASIIQRAGRCNRDGTEDGARIIWLDEGPIASGKDGRKRAAPYESESLNGARAVLAGLVGRSLSPSSMERLAANSERAVGQTLRRRDLLDLFDTSPDLSGLDIDVAPFIREDDGRTVSIFFREVERTPSGAPLDEDQPAPQRAELVRVPRGSIGSKRICRIEDHLNGGWIRREPSKLPPGATALLDAAEGGYDKELGWRPSSRRAVDVISLDGTQLRPAGIGDDSWSEGEPERLVDHLNRVASAAGQLADALSIGTWRADLVAAAALHDLGKAHAVFQAAIRKVVGGEAPYPDDVLLAKSGNRGRLRYERRFFRHEVASTLAVFAAADGLAIEHRELVSYLIAVHHGKVGMSIRPAAGEQRPAGTSDATRYALGVSDGDELPAVETPLGKTAECVLSLAPMELGAERSWADAMVRLRDSAELGPFRLGYLAALLRIADWRGSSA